MTDFEVTSPGTLNLVDQQAAEIERLTAENQRYRRTLQMIERDLGAEVAARHWAHEALGEHAVESAPWKDSASARLGTTADDSIKYGPHRKESTSG